MKVGPTLGLSPAWAVTYPTQLFSVCILLSKEAGKWFAAELSWSTVLPLSRLTYGLQVLTGFGM